MTASTIPGTPPHPSSEPVCPRCGWPDSEVYQVVSRHPTSTGVVVYTRCVCGVLQVRHQHAHRQPLLLARGAPSQPGGGGHVDLNQSLPCQR